MQGFWDGGGTGTKILLNTRKKKKKKKRNLNMESLGGFEQKIKLPKQFK